MPPKAAQLSPGSLKVTLRPFELKEIQTLVNLEKTGEDSWDKEMFAAYFKASKVNKRYAVIAEYGVSAVGYVLLELGNKENYVEIDRIFVNPKFRRRSVGS